MNCFIVFINCNLDDLVVLVTDKESEAMALAESLTPEDAVDLIATHELCDMSEPLCTSVGLVLSGKLVGYRRSVKSFT